jgi:hypothetical protein
MGAMLLIGCVTKVTEYNSENTMPNKMMVIIITTKPQMRTSTSSGVYLLFVIIGLLFFNLGWFNFGGQDRCYKILRTGLSEQTTRFLALRQVKLVWVLAHISIPVFTS